jgi:hypothetical protein
MELAAEKTKNNIVWSYLKITLVTDGNKFSALSDLI